MPDEHKLDPAFLSAQNWPGSRVELWSIDRISLCDKNARRHTAADVEAIASAILEWGWVSPIVVDEDGNIIAGEARFLAAQKLNLLVVPVIVARGWTEEQKRAYRIADNQLAARATWDFGRLGAELNDLKLAAFDIDLVGFELVELDRLLALACAPSQDPDAIPEVPPVPTTQLGDMWVVPVVNLVRLVRA